MRTPNPIGHLALVIFFFQAAGCYSWEKVPPGGMYDHYLSQTKRVRVETLDGWVGEIRRPSVQERYLVGSFSRGEIRREIPMDSIRLVEEREIDWTRTGIFLGVVGFAGYVSLFVLATQLDTY